MKIYGVSRSTKASPARVWELWRDPSNWSTWNSGIRGAQVEGDVAEGKTGKMTTERGSTHDVKFHDVKEGQGFSMSMAGPPGATFVFRCEISPDGGGSTIAQSVSMSGPLGFLFGAMMGNEMAKHFVPVLDGLANAAEGGG